MVITKRFTTIITKKSTNKINTTKFNPKKKIAALIITNKFTNSKSLRYIKSSSLFVNLFNKILGYK